ncbi:hypothetical protein IOD13_15115 [Brevibacterium casei]|nr:hypothetical protein [Brevibacterium casei]
MSDRSADIIYTGLREGEKLDEELFGDYEGAVVRVHERISRVEAPALDHRILPGHSASRQVIDLFCAQTCTTGLERPTEAELMQSPALASVSVRPESGDAGVVAEESLPEANDDTRELLEAVRRRFVGEPNAV